MSRGISVAAMSAINAQETSEAFVILLTITHDDLAEPIRLCTASENITSRSNSFIAYPFEIVLPADNDSVSASAKLKVDNIDRQIVNAIRSINSAASVLIEIVLASTPDTLEAVFADFILTNVTYDAFAVEGDLTIENFTAEPYPAATFSPAQFKGLF